MSRRTKPDVHVLSTAHDAADARLRRLCDALTAAGLTVLLEAIGTRPEHAPAGVGVVLHPRGTAAARVWRAAGRPLRSRARCLVLVDPDAVPAGVLWRTLRRGRLVVDVHEDYTALLRDRRWATGMAGSLAGLLVRVVVRATCAADLLVVADDHLLSGRRRLVVRNVPPLAEFTVTPPAPTPLAVYIGDVRASRGLEEMVRGVAGAPPWRLGVVGPVSDVDRTWALAQFAAAGRPHDVVFHGRLPSRQSWEAVEGAWAGLALLHDTPAYRAAVPTKVYEYAAAGLATLATPLPRVQCLLEQSGGGAVAAGAEQVSAVLRRWAEHPEQVQEHGRRARSWAQAELAATAPFAEFAEQVQRLLDGGRW